MLDHDQIEVLVGQCDMKKLSILALLISLPLLAQQKQPVSSLQEDCGVQFAFTVQSSGVNAAGTVTAGSPGTTAVIDNTQAGCLVWMVTYSTTTGITGVSLLFQTATNAAGVPGTWSAYGGTLTVGVNPNVAATPPWAITQATGTKYPFLRMNLTSLTGAGTVSGKLYGWKTRPTYVTVAAGGGCPGTIGTPCVVVGTKTNNNAAPGADNVGVLPGLANAAAPSYTEGDQVLASLDLAGNLRTLSAIAGNSAILSDQQAVTGSAVALATHATRSVCVKALVSNMINVFVGPAGVTTANGFLLAPGESFCIPANNTNLFFVIASTTGASVSWAASN